MRVGDELIAVQIGHERRVQPVALDDFGERRHPLRQRAKQLAEGIRVQFQLGNTGTLTGNAEELNVHAAS